MTTPAAITDPAVLARIRAYAGMLDTTDADYPPEFSDANLAYYYQLAGHSEREAARLALLATAARVARRQGVVRLTGYEGSGVAVATELRALAEQLREGMLPMALGAEAAAEQARVASVGVAIGTVFYDAADQTWSYQASATQKRALTLADLILDRSIAGGKLMLNAVGADELRALSVETADLVSGAVTLEKLAAAVVALINAPPAAGSITHEMLGADVVDHTNVEHNSLTINELPSGASPGKYLDGDGSWKDAVALSDDAPLVEGTASAGTGTEASRDDHVHPSGVGGGGSGGVAEEDAIPFGMLFTEAHTRTFAETFNFDTDPDGAFVSDTNSVPSGAPSGVTDYVGIGYGASNVDQPTWERYGVGDWIRVKSGSNYIIARVQYVEFDDTNKLAEFWFDPDTDEAHTLAYDQIPAGSAEIRFYRMQPASKGPATGLQASVMTGDGYAWDVADLEQHLFGPGLELSLGPAQRYADGAYPTVHGAWFTWSRPQADNAAYVFVYAPTGSSLAIQRQRLANHWKVGRRWKVGTGLIGGAAEVVFQITSTNFGHGPLLAGGPVGYYANVAVVSGAFSTLSSGFDTTAPLSVLPEFPDPPSSGAAYLKSNDGVMEWVSISDFGIPDVPDAPVAQATTKFYELEVPSSGSNIAARFSETTPYSKPTYTKITLDTTTWTNVATGLVDDDLISVSTQFHYNYDQQQTVTMKFADFGTSAAWYTVKGDDGTRVEVRRNGTAIQAREQYGGSNNPSGTIVMVINWGAI